MQELVTIDFDFVDDDGGPEVCAVKGDMMFVIPRSQVYATVTGDGGSVELAKWKAVEIGLWV